MAANNRNRNVKSVKKIESLKDYKKLKLQEEFLEKNLSSTIKGLKIDADLICRIDDDRLKASAQREVEMQEIAREVFSVVKELNRLKSTIQEADAWTIRTLDVSDCGSRLTKLSNKIEDLKRAKSVLEELAREEEALSGDLQEFERPIFTDRLQPNTKNTADRKCPMRLEGNDDFTELVARTGHTEGWTSEDHSLFLKIRNKCDSVPQLVIELKKKRPHLTNEEIVNHEAWQKVYDELRDKRKKEIANWRSRNRNRTETGSSGVFEIDKRGTEVRKNKNKSVADNKKSEDIERNADHDNKKKMIDEWKAEKARKSAMDEEQKKRLEKARLDDEKRRREAKRSQAMLKLTDYRNKIKKPSTSGSEGQIRPISHPNFSSLKLINSFREQDEKFMQKRLSRLKLLERNPYENESSKSNMIRKTRSREYSTLFRPTKVWEERCKRDINVEDQFGRVNYVKDIQRLSTTGGCKAEDK